MKLQFKYSKEIEKQKLLDIYDEYMWFIDNDFPIILPNFFSIIYQDNKKVFYKNLNFYLNSIYSKDNYKSKIEIIKNKWNKIENEVFTILTSYHLKLNNKYYCHTSMYGPEGQFKYPNIINLRIANNKDIKSANESIVHEIIHLIIYNKVKKLKLNYEQVEGLVDLFFIETKLKNIFPKYKIQNVGIIDKQLFNKLFKIKK